MYNKELIQDYWLKEGNALQQRWSEFLKLSVPYLTRMATYMVRGGVEELQKNDAQLARDARVGQQPTPRDRRRMLRCRFDAAAAAAPAPAAGLADVTVTTPLTTHHPFHRRSPIPDPPSPNGSIQIIMEELGPTYIKVGQMMSVRPDVLPQAALDELAVLQDSVEAFSTR